ncbi:hypothetical protein DSL72_002274 [Monilinia vaccinii-corymbosi]|uniref:Uncharacterized protein n=1 Tax=Monilinia vaccinii-corymbosi TaxID=61207 RepID=A0A8A3PC58_9HELO|nr:hypothetical protein DSL72_002274 [Monilinia vaccinii-corymbosi]
MLLLKVIQIALLPALALAGIITRDNTFPKRASQSAVDILKGIATNAATNCAGQSFADECSTVAHSAPFLITAMQQYQVDTAGEIGAVLALMAYETVDFKYNINHSPGRPGQGTRNMQMASYNLQYAQSIPALQAPLAKITTAKTVDGLSNDVLNQIRALVLVDDYAWATGAWFLKTVCGPDVSKGLRAGDQAGWEGYMKCVGVDGTDSARLAYWTRAKSTMGF